MLKWLAFLLSTAVAAGAQAQVAGSPTYLIYPDQATCLARSKAQCVALGCDGVHTIYWWSCDTGPLKSGLVGSTAVAAGSYAMRLESAGPFAATHPQRSIGLTAAEGNKLVTSTAIAPVLSTASTSASTNNVVSSPKRAP